MGGWGHGEKGERWEGVRHKSSLRREVFGWLRGMMIGERGGDIWSLRTGDSIFDTSSNHDISSKALLSVVGYAGTSDLKRSFTSWRLRSRRHEREIYRRYSRS